MMLFRGKDLQTVWQGSKKLHTVWQAANCFLFLYLHTVSFSGCKPLVTAFSTVREVAGGREFGKSKKQKKGKSKRGEEEARQ
jgi:hypothetical protein